MSEKSNILQNTGDRRMVFLSCGVAGNRLVSAGGGRKMRRGNGRVQYGLVAKFSSRWHALMPDKGKGIHKGNELRACPMDPQDVANSLRFAGEEGTTLDFMAFYDTPAEALRLLDALASLGLQKELPASAQEPILRVGRGAHCDRVIVAERLPDGSFTYTGFMIPQ